MARPHQRYDEVRTLLDGRFGEFRRRAVVQGLDMDRMELWHDLLEAALAADLQWSEPAGTEAWEVFILEKVELRFGGL